MELSTTPCMSAHLSAAVGQCCDARNRVFFQAVYQARQAAPTPQPSVANEEELLRLVYAHSTYETDKRATIAYRHAMPDPSTRQGVKDYIACVVHGMTVGALSAGAGADLLSAAKIALAGVKYSPSPGAQKEKRFSEEQNDVDSFFSEVLAQEI